LPDAIFVALVLPFLLEESDADNGYDLILISICYPPENAGNKATSS